MGPITYDPCASDELEGCVIYNRRFWDIFAVDGDRFMWDTLTTSSITWTIIKRVIPRCWYWVRLDEAPIELVED